MPAHPERPAFDNASVSLSVCQSPRMTGSGDWNLAARRIVNYEQHISVTPLITTIRLFARTLATEDDLTMGAVRASFSR